MVISIALVNDYEVVVRGLSSMLRAYQNRVRIREAFLKPGCTIGLGNAEVKFYAADEKVEIVACRCSGRKPAVE